MRAGEIVGLAGLVGAGPLGDPRDRLRRPPGHRRHGHRRRQAAAPRLGRRARSRAGVGLAPEERKSQGLLLDEAVYRNITVSRLGRFARGGFLDRGAERRRPTEQTDARSTSGPPASTARSRTLSGGNQQKVVLARWLLRDCRVLLLDEPTRGVDVGARSEIYALIRALADAGVAVVVVSSEIEEVLGLADRVLVDPRGPRRRTRARPPRSTSTGSSTWSWKERAA